MVVLRELAGEGLGGKRSLAHSVKETVVRSLMPQLGLALDQLVRRHADFQTASKNASSSSIARR